MDISDILGPGGHTKRPEHPDMDRIMEITSQMLAEMRENDGNPVEQERLWRARVEESVDFDSLAYQAIQVAMSLNSIQTSLDWARMIANPGRHMGYVKTVQAFYDGFLTGVQFEKRGGKR